MNVSILCSITYGQSWFDSLLVFMDSIDFLGGKLKRTSHWLTAERYKIEKYHTIILAHCRCYSLQMKNGYGLVSHRPLNFFTVWSTETYKRGPVRYSHRLTTSGSWENSMTTTCLDTWVRSNWSLKYCAGSK